jgi:hypothetical protein
MIGCQCPCCPTNMTNGFATPYDLMTFQKRCFPNELIDIDRTLESWVKRKAPTSQSAPI